MKDYVKRFLIVALMAFFISLLFIGGKAQASSIDKDVWLWPADGVISDYFGTRHGKHYGVDIAGEWNSGIYAAYEGAVIKSYYSYSYGNVIMIEHPNGYVTVYAHLQQRLKQVGDFVTAGELIGTMGTTGGSTGVHLHFEVHHAEWNYAKSNVIDPFAIFGRMKIGQFSSVQERIQYVQNVLHHRKREKLSVDGLWKNLDETESTEKWMESSLELVEINRHESYHFISIRTDVRFAERTNPISELNFSAIFLLLAIPKRKKNNGEALNLVPCLSICLNNRLIMQRFVASNLVRVESSSHSVGQMQYSHVKRIFLNLYLLAVYKARLRLRQIQLSMIEVQKRNKRVIVPI